MDTPPVLWLVQTNLGDPGAAGAIRAACQRNDLLFRGFDRIPFSDALPDIDHDGPIIVYGATRFVKAVIDARRWSPGAFFDEATFTVSTCLRHWRDWMVNGDAAVLRIDALGDLSLADTDEVFVRPDGDLKDFAGEVTTFGALQAWAATLVGDDVTLDGSLLVAVARPKRIDAEWRVFAAERSGIIAATRYRRDGRLAPEAGAPPEVLAFAAERLRDWMPAPLVALDIAAAADGLRILELSDFHSAGHYAADVEAIVVQGSAAAERHWLTAAGSR